MRDQPRSNRQGKPEERDYGVKELAMLLNTVLIS